MDLESARALESAADWLAASEFPVFFTGAGISVESGLSDFRSPGGVWSRYRPVYYQEFVADRGARERYWAMKRELQREFDGARPNAGHLALARLERAGRLGGLITQNIDGLHLDAGTSPERLIELHGTNRRAHCLGCGRKWPIGEVVARIDAGEAAPDCPDCGSPIKPSTVSFGQPMPERETRLGFQWARKSDFFMAIGSSLTVQPAADMPRAAREAGARLIVLNRDPTPLDPIAHAVARESCGAFLAALADRLGA